MRLPEDGAWKKNIAIIAGAAVLACLLYLTSSSERALRTAVFFHSPRSGITMEYQLERHTDERAKLYTITKNPPKETATDAELITWIVYRLGPLCFARYYGEG